MHADPSKAEVLEARALVCETVARWVVEQLGRQEGWTVLSARFAVVECEDGEDEEEGEETMPLSGECLAVSREGRVGRSARRSLTLLGADFSRSRSSSPSSLLYPFLLTWSPRRRTALETASDSQATYFLSSPTIQRCVFALWRGLLVQTNFDDGDPHTGIVGIRYELVSPVRARAREERS